MTPHYPLILDGLTIVLLAATIVYAAILNRRLGRLRDNRAELDRAARRFAEAADRADAGIKTLKQAADHTGAALQRDLDRAQSLRDELSFLVEAGEALAVRLEAVARAAGRSSRGGAGRAEPALRTVAGTGAAKPAGAESTPDRDLLQAIETMR